MTVLASTVSVSRTAISTQATELLAVLRMFSVRGWFVAAVGGIAVLALIGVPTAIIDNPFFIRMTPVRIQDYAIWAVTALLAGVIAGTFALPAHLATGGRILSGGFLSYLAVGCPICNKVVVLLLGVSGALAYFAPVQIYIGVASLLLLIWTLRLRVRAVLAMCPVRVPADLAGSEHDGHA